MNYINKAFISGLIILIIGTIVSFIVGKLNKSSLPPVCKDWNKNFIMEICLFLTGFLSYFVYHKLKL